MAVATEIVPNACGLVGTSYPGHAGRCLALTSTARDLPMPTWPMTFDANTVVIPSAVKAIQP